MNLKKPKRPTFWNRESNIIILALALLMAILFFRVTGSFINYVGKKEKQSFLIAILLNSTPKKVKKGCKPFLRTEGTTQWPSAWPILLVVD